MRIILLALSTCNLGEKYIPGRGHPDRERSRVRSNDRKRGLLLAERPSANVTLCQCVLLCKRET